MKLEKLVIDTARPYEQASHKNPYQARIDVSWNENRMTVALSQEACVRILALAADEIAAAAQIQINDFVENAITFSATPVIEGEADV